MSAKKDAGLWNDRQKDALRPIFEFIKANGARVGVQLCVSHSDLHDEWSTHCRFKIRESPRCHAGRKGSTLAPALSASTIAPHLQSNVADEGADGWPEEDIAPSAIAHDEGKYVLPKEMGKEEFEEVRKAFGDAARRAVEAGSSYFSTTQRQSHAEFGHRT